MTNERDRRPAVDVQDVSQSSAQRRRSINIKKSDLDWAAEQGVIPAHGVEQLWQALLERSAEAPKFDIAHLLWYAGASVVLLAMGWFLVLMTITGSPALVLGTATLYTVAFVAFGYHLYFGKSLKVPGGLLYTLSVAMVPVLGLAGMATAGMTDFGAGHQLVLEVATVVAAVAALSFVRFPFLTMPLYASLWAMIWTVVHGFTDAAMHFSWQHDLMLTMVFGGLITAVAFLTDRRTQEDYSFWGYFFGASAFWGAWTIYAFDVGGHGLLFAYFATNVVFLLASVLLQRRIFALGGGIGIAAYLSYLAFDIFDGSMAFPLILTLIGAAVIFAGVQYHKHSRKIERMVTAILPGVANRIRKDS